MKVKIIGNMDNSSKNLTKAIFDIATERLTENKSLIENNSNKSA